MIKELIKGKKEALIVLAISLPLFTYGAFSFELGGEDSIVEAISVAISLILGIFGVISGMVLLVTKTNLGLFNSKKSKPIIKEEKKMETHTEKDTQEDENIYSGSSTREQTHTLNKPVQVSESIRLMNQEKQLVDLIILQAENLDRLKQELTACQTRLKAKGWVLTNTGEWGTE
jgi:hypothetical protein